MAASVQVSDVTDPINAVPLAAFLLIPPFKNQEAAALSVVLYALIFIRNDQAVEAAIVNLFVEPGVLPSNVNTVFAVASDVALLAIKIEC